MSRVDSTSCTETEYGDVGVLTYEPLDSARIEAGVRSTKAGAVVTFVSTWKNFKHMICLMIIYALLLFWLLASGWLHPR